MVCASQPTNWQTDREAGRQADRSAGGQAQTGRQAARGRLTGRY